MCADGKMLILKTVPINPISTDKYRGAKAPNIPRKAIMVNTPSVNTDDYFVTEDVNTPAKHGTTVQSGWAAADKFLKPKKESGSYATDFKTTENPQLVRFLGNEPVMIYEQHWINRTEGKRSFVCLGEDCPLCTIAGDQPRARFVFNVLVLTDEEPNVQLLTATPTLAKMLRAKNDDPKFGPLSKFFWAISRQGTATTTQYILERVKPADLAEEWSLDIEEVEAAIASAVIFDDSAIYVSPKEELLKLARQLVTQ